MAESKEQLDGADKFLLADARFLLNALENGLPTGETPDEVAEILALRIRQLETMKPCRGRGALIIDLTNRLTEYQKLAEQNQSQPQSAPPAESEGEQVQMI